MNKNFLIGAEELDQIINSNNTIVIDTRDPLVYNQGHIPNAINIHEIFTYICTNDNGGYPAMVKYFSTLFKEHGIQKENEVIIYEDAMDNGYGQSCRGWFLFNYLGHNNVSVLHGGIRAWKAKDFPINKQKRQLPETEYNPIIDHSIMVDAHAVLDAIDDPNVVIVDVRDYAEWLGANSSPYGYDFCPRKGRIPSAVWLEWYQLMMRKDGIPWFKSIEEISEACQKVGITKDKTVYLYCFKGARTSNTMLAMQMAGYKVKNYFSSWNEWSRDPKLPVEEDYPKNS